MKGIQHAIGLASTILFIQPIFASTGPFFQITETGAPGTVKMTVCLNAKSALSCQNYTLSKLGFSIVTTIPNHTYPDAGIKINTPNYTINNVGGMCTTVSNDYCMFSANHDVAKSVTIQESLPAPTIKPAIAAGFYSNGTTFRPIIANSQDGGISWAYTANGQSPQLPDDSQENGQATLFSSSCSSSNCIAAGYYSNSTNDRPLVASSHDGGLSWEYTITASSPDLPGDLDGRALLTKSSCSGSHCITAGSYSNGTVDRPLVASSQNGGMSWSYTINGTGSFLPDNTNYNHEISLSKGASCSGSNCVVTGSYYDNDTNTRKPLAISSNDGGITWVNTINSMNPTLPDDLNGQDTLGNVSCSGSNCIAVGSYFNGTFNTPLVASSHDSGMTWTYTIFDNNPELPGDVNGNSYLIHASCSGSNCIASGYYFNGTDDRPLVASSNDGGTTWAYTVDGNTPTLLNVNGQAHLDGGASCSGSKCIATGFYNDGSYNRPLVATSQNGGMSWTYTIDSERPQLPNDANGQALEGFMDGGASCDGSNCIALGRYLSGANTRPLIANSTDGGLNWTYALDGQKPALPSDVSGEVLMNGGISLSNNAYLSDSLMFLSVK